MQSTLSTQEKIRGFLQSHKEGATFINDDFKHLGDYSCIRSAIVRLCKKNELVRVCQGVYMIPYKEHLLPDCLTIAGEIARKSGGIVKYKDDITINNVRIYSVYTNSSTRSLFLDNGTIIKFIHSNDL